MKHIKQAICLLVIGIASQAFVVEAYAIDATGCEATYTDATASADANGYPVIYAWTTTTDEATDPGSANCVLGREMATNNYPYVHHYTTTITVKSPSGRTTTQTTYGQEQGRSGVGTNTANTSIDVCDPMDELPDCELGDWSYEGSESSTCSIAGFFYSSVINFNITIALTDTYGANTLGSQIIGDTRFCNYTLACSNNITPTCQSRGFTVQYPVSETCPAYLRLSNLAIRINGASPACFWVAFNADGPGPCS